MKDGDSMTLMLFSSRKGKGCVQNEWEEQKKCATNLEGRREPNQSVAVTNLDGGSDWIPHFFCGQGGNRTPDAQIFSLPLYRLSYLPYFAQDFLSFVGQAQEKDPKIGPPKPWRRRVVVQRLRGVNKSENKKGPKVFKKYF